MTTLHRSNVSLVGAVGLTVLGALAGLRAAAEELPSDIFREAIEVRVINLEAVVSDKDGQRVSRLEPGDFRLLVDGEETPIQYFTEIRDGAVIESPNGVPALQGVDSVGTNFLLFIDEFFSIQNDSRRVLRAVAERVETMRPADRAAVVAWDGRNLDLLQDWTGSKEEMKAALEAALERPTRGLQREAEQRQWLDQRAAAAMTPRGARTEARYRLGPQEERYAHILVTQLQSAVGAAAAAMRGMETPPGRKAMLLLSGGWPWDPAQWVAANYRRMISDPQFPRGAEIYGSLSDTANLLGYTVYGVDVPGLQTSGGVDASRRTPRAGLGSDFLLEGEVHDSLEFLAAETGGRALLNGLRVQALDEVGRDVRSYYWLGFSPDWGKDGEQHDIRVEVASPDLEVRARQGYLDLTPQQQAAFAVQSSLLFGEAGGDEALQVELGEPEKAKKGKLNLPVTISLPASQLVAVERDGQWVIELDLVLAAMDEGGGQAVTQPIPLVFTSPRKPGPAEKVVYETGLTVRKRTSELALAVYDRNGERTLTRLLVKGEG